VLDIVQQLCIGGCCITFLFLQTIRLASATSFQLQKTAFSHLSRKMVPRSSRQREPPVGIARSCIRDSKFSTEGFLNENTSNSFTAEKQVPLCPSLFTPTDISPTNPTAYGTLLRIDNGSKDVAKEGTKIHMTEFSSFGTKR